MTISFVNGKRTDGDSTTNNQDGAPNQITQKVSNDVSAFTSSQKKYQQHHVTSTKTTSTSVRDKVALWEKLGRRCSKHSASVAPLNTHHHHQQNRHHHHHRHWKQPQDRPGRPTTSKSKSLSSLPTKNYTTTSTEGSYADRYLKLLVSEQNNNNNPSNSDNTNFINSRSRFQLTKTIDLHESLRSIGSDDEDDHYNSNNKRRIPIFRSGSTTSDDDCDDFNDDTVDDEFDVESDGYYNSNHGDDGCLQLVLTDDKKLTYSHSWSHSNPTANPLILEKEEEFAALIDQVCMTTVQNTAPLASIPSSDTKKIKQKDLGHVRSTLSFVMSSFRNTKKQATRPTKDDVDKDEENLVDDGTNNSSTKKKKKNDSSKKKKTFLSTVLPPTTPVVARSKDKFTDIVSNSNNNFNKSKNTNTNMERQLFSICQVPPSILEKEHDDVESESESESDENENDSINSIIHHHP